MSPKEKILRKQIKEAKAKLERLREQPTVKSIGVGYLIESDLDKASVLLSAEAIADSFEDMAAKVGRIESNDLIPMDKSLKAQFGDEAANRFYTAVQTTIRGLLDQLKQAQDTVNKEVESLRSGTAPNDMANKEPPEEPPAPPSEPPAAGPDAGPDLGSEAEPDDAGAPLAPEGGPEGHDEAPVPAPQPGLGRERKLHEETETFSDQRILNAFVFEMKKCRDPQKSARRVAERFGIDAEDVREIVMEAASKSDKPAFLDKEKNGEEKDKKEKGGSKKPKK